VVLLYLYLAKPGPSGEREHLDCLEKELEFPGPGNSFQDNNPVVLITRDSHPDSNHSIQTFRRCGEVICEKCLRGFHRGFK
jgi:hypothetical protein